MQSLDTGTLFIKTKRLEETAEHLSRLSIRCMLNGEQFYKVGSNDHLVNPNNFLVINQGQRYRTAFEGDSENEMIMVGFKPGFAESLLYSLETADDHLLDKPFDSHQPVLFFEKTYPTDDVIQEQFHRLRRLIDKDISVRKETDLEEIYTLLLKRLLQLHRHVKEEITNIKSLRKSTRVELFRRLSIAKDFIEAHLNEKIKLDDVARVACLSVHHFKRSFKDLFGVSPHRYLINKRIEKAQRLLYQGVYSVNEICLLTGFENTSSFIRLFRQRVGTTPSRFHSN